VSERSTDYSANDIAIIGMACRVPGAGNIDEFWNNLRNGVESISYLSERELDPYEARIESPPTNYVRAAAILEDADLFDADFFDMAPKEAQLTDPQHRVYLECAWEALENAGYTAEQYNGLIGVYGGAGFNSYLAHQIRVDKDALVSMGYLQALISSEKDYLSSRVSYKLNLKGPSLTVQTACSTALSAVYLAYQGLLTYQCDLALAGGVSVKCPQNAGYFYVEDGIQSPDGHTRSFDASARGTVFGSGVGIVVLKRLSDARADGDTIYAIIKGAAMNNDGSSKVGYTALSPQGLSQVVAMAIETAGIDASTISYVEAHGFGTHLGDTIEIAGLERAFRGRLGRAVCPIGSVKSNFGHLTAAAGAAALIKTVLALKNRQIPPSLHFDEPNPDINWADCPFYVNTALSNWRRTNSPRRAGVNSMGIGGTNVHVILEEAPELPASQLSKWPCQLLLLSAKTESALERLTVRMASHFERYTDENLADAAYTLQCGRKRFAKRRMLTCRDTIEAADKLHRLDGDGIFTNLSAEPNRPVVFMFPGEWTQQTGMGEFLYNRSSIFRNELDRCSTLLKPELGVELRDLLSFNSDATVGADDMLRQTAFVQPALFAIEYAMAKLFTALGIGSAAMIGHGIGEYVAACLAGVFSLEDALALVCARGRLMQSLPSGAMLAAAPHSAMMEGILDVFAKEVAGVRLKAPQIPYVSNVTGSWITGAEAMDPAYWTRHLRSPVLFCEGASLLFQEKRPIFVELGPGDTLTSLVEGILKDYSPSEIVAAMGSVGNDDDASEHFLRGLGFLWLHGASVSWGTLYADDQRRRVPLPTYPFERKSYWVGAEPLRFDVRERKDLGNGYTNPCNTLEEEVLQIWEEVLGTQGAGGHSNFFELGGNSLIGIQVVSRIRQHFQIEFSLESLFESPSPSALATIISRKLDRSEKSEEEANRLTDLNSI
jgi:acyl transferase domain-containing protein